MKKLLLLLAIGLIAASVANGQQAARSIVSVPYHKPSSSQSRPDLSKRSMGRSEATTSTYNDQLVLSFVYGNGSSASNLPLDYFEETTLMGWYGLVSPDTALWFPMISWDSATNTATNNVGGPAAITYTMTLTSSDTSITAFAFPVSIAVPAGNYAAMSLTFKSGSTDYPSLTTGDTVVGPDSTVYQSYFQPTVAFVENGSTVQFPYYLGPEPGPTPITDDITTGYFKAGSSIGSGWSPFYIPNWAFNGTSGGAYYQQYPYIWFHVAGMGWYDYVDSVFNPNIATYGAAGDSLAFIALDMWNDTTAEFFGYSPGWYYNVSIGLSFQPFASDWPAGLILDTTTAYTIDSVMIGGTYHRADAAISAGATAVKNVANEVNAYPNPANNAVTIAFSLAAVSDVNVSLVNMVGQVVDNQIVKGVCGGNVEFNTTTLADGVYFYTLNAGVYSSTGRIVIAQE